MTTGNCDKHFNMLLQTDQIGCTGAFDTLKDARAKINVDCETFFPISHCQLSTENINLLYTHVCNTEERFNHDEYRLCPLVSLLLYVQWCGKTIYNADIWTCKNNEWNGFTWTYKHEIQWKCKTPPYPLYSLTTDRTKLHISLHLLCVKY